MTKEYSFDARPWLILCEGESDKRFLDNLIVARGIPNSFQIRFPDRGRVGCGGRSEFGPWLALVRETSELFNKNIRSVLIVSDNDQDPVASLEAVKASLAKAVGFPVPDTERVIAKADTYPDIVVLMLPHGEPGTLETLCLRAAYDKWAATKAPLDAFVGGTAAKGWHIGKQSKMRLQSLIAATCEARPDAGFAGLWRENEKFHIPLKSAAFDDISDFLQTLLAP
jgi:hypothetical protein